MAVGMPNGSVDASAFLRTPPGLRKLLPGLPWYALAPTMLSLIVALRGIDSVGYWVDEFYTLNAVRSGFGEHLGEAPYLPYYTVVWVASGGGTCLSETCLRVPSAIAVALAVLVTAFAGRRLTNRWGGFAAGLMLALSPGVQRFAQDARPYAIGLLFVCLATLLLVIATSRQSRFIWLSYSLTLAALGLIAPIGLAVLVGHAVLIGQRPLWNRNLRHWLASLLLLVPVLALQAYWLFSGGAGRSASGDAFVVHPQNLIQGVAWPFSAATQIGAGEAAFAAVLLTLAIWSKRGVRWLIAFGSSAAAIWLLSFGPSTWWQARTLLPLSGLLVIGASVTLATAPRAGIVSVLVILGLFSSTTYSAIRLPWSRGYDYRQAVGIVDSRWESGDRIDPGAQLPWVVQWALEHYAPDGSRFLDETSSLTGRVWVFGGDAPCSPAAEWDLGIGNALYLCETGRTS